MDVSRTAEYGALTPTWIEYVVKPAMGADPRDVPETGIAAVNFAFDVTPAELIAAIVTEVGVLRPPYTESIAAAFRDAP